MAETTVGSLIRQKTWVRLGLAFCSGLVMALGTPPFDLWWLALMGLTAACVMFRLSPSRARASTGWMVAVGYFGLSLNWIVEPFMVDAALTGWMAPFALGGLAGGLALFWGVAFWAADRSRQGLWALVIAWTLAEFGRTYVLTGFPWGLVSYIWLESPAIQWVSVVGPHGLTLFTVAFCSMVAQALLLRRQQEIIASGVLAVALIGGGTLLTPPPQDVTGRPIVRMVQPNAAQHEKWDPRMVPVFFDRQVRFTEAAADALGAPDLIVWPETALPMLLHNAGDALDIISDAAGPASVVVGIQRGEGGRYYNSLIRLDATGQVTDVYDKHHLVPFGEYMPAPKFWSLFEIGGLAARAEGGYTPGPGPRLLDGGRLGMALPLICYEAVFPQDLLDAPARPDWLLQVTNDAWFGTWSGPYQHLAQARVRAIEQGLPMLRVANTGVSAMIDGAGRVLDSIPLGEAGYLDTVLPPPLRFTIYAQSGDLPMLVVLLAASVALFLRRRRLSVDQRTTDG